jgi:hypothetical protein
MSRERSSAVEAARPTPVDQTQPTRSTDVDLDVVLQLLNESITETGNTIDSLAAHFAARGTPKDRSYISKVLRAEKPLSYEFIVGLPDDVEAAFEQKRARHFGFIVASVPTSREEGVTSLLSGLAMFSMPSLPARADRLAKVEVLPTTKKGIA